MAVSDSCIRKRRHLVGLVVKGSAAPPKGVKLFSGDREVGWISSATELPKLNAPIAFGFPLRDFSKPDTALPFSRLS